MNTSTAPFPTSHRRTIALPPGRYPTLARSRGWGAEGSRLGGIPFEAWHEPVDHPDGLTVTVTTEVRRRTVMYTRTCGSAAGYDAAETRVRLTPDMGWEGERQLADAGYDLSPDPATVEAARAWTEVRTRAATERDAARRA